MIRLRVDDQSLNTIRLALSPLWETMGSLALLARYRGEVPSPYTSWARTVRQGMPPELAEGLVGLIRRPDPPSLIRAAVLHVPDPSRTDLAAELKHLRESHAGEPGDDELVGQLERYWDWAVAPYWTSIRSSLEEEVLLRGRTLAVEGPEAMLGELGGRVTWRRPQLTAPYHRELTCEVTDSKLLLVPTVFSGGLRLFTTEHEGIVAMSYQARATGFFHTLTRTERKSESDDRLALLLGGGRAQVLRALEVPKTTTAVAESLGLAKSTVSQHLNVLTSAGVVWRQRLGGRVFYQLDRGGFALLEHLGY
jgi:DNA-binding transcriptional ArsR family regulator